MTDTVTFDHYEVLTRDDGSLHELGRGAMGITYKAFDTNLRIPVALKVINTAALNTESARHHFVREARSAARLRHRHVASVFHLGMDGETYFYAMEFIDGETVEALIRRGGPLHPVLALRIAVQVARALSAAQACGLVHRDIKPANLMLVREDEEACVKVIDFGLAMSSATEGDDEAAAAHAHHGFVGTPHFASPEQLEDREIDIRSDIYSLGVTLWFLLTGKTPFTGPLEQVMQQHLSAPPPMELLGNVAPPLAALLRRMLAKDPADRHQTPAEVRQEMEGVLAAPASSRASETAEEIVELEVPQIPLLSDTSMAVGATHFEAGAVVGAYEIVQALGETNAGRIFRARDRVRGCEVRLLVLNRDLTGDGGAFTQIEQEVERIAAVQHPNLVRVFALEVIGDAGVLVSEWVDGFSLLELLRTRRELPPAETLALLEGTAAGVDHALEAGLRRLDISLHQVFVHFPGGAPAAEEVLRSPVSAWPAFAVKANPLGMTRELAMSETWAGGRTVVSDGSAAAAARTIVGADGAAAGASDPRPRYLRTLGGLVYELLGGALPPLAMVGANAALPTRYTPLANLSEEGNEVLRCALDPARSFATAGEFFTALREVAAHDGGSHTTRFTTHSTQVRPVPPLAGAPPFAPPQREITPQPAPAKKAPVALLVGVAAVLAIGATIYALKSHSDPTRSPDVRSDPSSTASSDATPAPPDADPEPRSTTAQEPAAPPAPTSQQMLKSAVAAAEETENEGDWSKSVGAWLQIAKDHPESEIGRVRLELLIDGWRKQRGSLAEADIALLREPLIEAAEHDVLAAMMLLGETLRASDPATSFRWFSAAAEKGNAAAMTEVGLMLSNGRGTERNLEKAVTLFQAAAEKGDAAAKMALANCYLSAKGVAKNEKRAVELLQEAADEGNVRAMNRLGTCYHHGTGVRKNIAKAVELFARAADLGYGESIGNLGVIYILGDGVPKNAKKAVELFEEGAKAGDGYCMYLFAVCLETGDGVPANRPEAEGWYRQAAEADHPKAVEWCRKNGVQFKPKGSV